MSDANKKSRLLIAATKSGGGKTTITCGLINCLMERGLRVSSVKCGPDYIDPMFHRQVLGIDSGNIDTFFTDANTTRYLLDKKITDSDITIMEGVMGYYDGVGGVLTKGSAYDVAGITSTPVILVVDGKGASVSLVAIIKGIIEYKKDSNIKGIILNRVSAPYFERLKKLIEEELGIAVLGYLPELKSIEIPSRHLGLVAPEEIDDFKQWITRVSTEIKNSIDIDKLIGIADTAKVLDDIEEVRIPKLEKEINIAVARDEAFSFYYSENLELLEEMGAKLHYFSPLRDKSLPDNIDCILLGGGYPENFAKQLSDNKEMLKCVRSAAANLPIIAECGGFMYLMDELCDMNGDMYKLAAVIPGSADKKDRLVRFGYINLETVDGWIRAHEFHRWDTDNNGEDMLAVKPVGQSTYKCIHYNDKLLAGFPHLYYYSNVDFIHKYLQRIISKKHDIKD